MQFLYILYFVIDPFIIFFYRISKLHDHFPSKNIFPIAVHPTEWFRVSRLRFQGIQVWRIFDVLPHTMATMYVLQSRAHCHRPRCASHPCSDRLFFDPMSGVNWFPSVHFSWFWISFSLATIWGIVCVWYFFCDCCVSNPNVFHANTYISLIL